MRRKICNYKGHVIRRGSDAGRPDDRPSRWYIDHKEAIYLDQRGPGYRTLREARKAIDSAEEART